MLFKSRICDCCSNVWESPPDETIVRSGVVTGGTEMRPLLENR